MCMEREEDAKALANCKDLKLRGKFIDICMEKVLSKQTLLGLIHIKKDELSHQMCFFV